MNMTFKELTLELIEQGWRCYLLEEITPLLKGDSLDKFAKRNHLEIRVYEGKPFVFVKNHHLKGSKVINYE